MGHMWTGLRVSLFISPTFKLWAPLVPKQINKITRPRLVATLKTRHHVGAQGRVCTLAVHTTPSQEQGETGCVQATLLHLLRTVPLVTLLCRALTNRSSTMPKSPRIPARLRRAVRFSVQRLQV